MDIDENNEDEEISIDFSKIKNLFKKKKDNKEQDTKISPPQENIEKPEHK